MPSQSDVVSSGVAVHLLEQCFGVPFLPTLKHSQSCSNRQVRSRRHEIVAPVLKLSISQFETRGERMATERQRRAARKNIKKAAAAAKTKRTIAHLPKATRTALGKQASKVRKQKASLS